MSRGQDVLIPEFFAGKNVFVTGGHGFIGKVFTEKLLRSCKDVRNIFWLIREKRGVEPKVRLRKALDNVLFDKVRAENPAALNKVKVMTGNLEEDNLGLSQEDLKLLTEQVHILVHSAATVRFNEPLAVAINLNVKGTREVCQLALKMQNLEVFCYVSTLYCQHDKQIVEEKFYPAFGDWRQAIEIAKNFDQDQLNVLCGKFIGANPNTYTFSKSLAEHCVRDLCKGRVPVVVFRPGIVTAVYEDPLPGWADAITGPFSLIYGAILGAIKTSYMDKDKSKDEIPADYIVKGMISSIHKKGVESSPLEEIAYYNGTHKGTKYGETSFMFDEFLSKLRIKMNVYPKVYHKRSYSVHILCFYALQLLPAFLTDLANRIFFPKNSNFSMVRVQRKIYENIKAYGYFATNEWKFVNGNFMGILGGVKGDDFGEFGVEDREHPSFDVEYTVRAMEFMHKHLLGMELTQKPNGVERIKRIKFWTHFVIYGVCALISFYCLRGLLYSTN